MSAISRVSARHGDVLLMALRGLADVASSSGAFDEEAFLEARAAKESEHGPARAWVDGHGAGTWGIPESKQAREKGFRRDGRQGSHSFHSSGKGPGSWPRKQGCRGSSNRGKYSPSNFKLGRINSVVDLSGSSD